MRTRPTPSLGEDTRAQYERASRDATALAEQSSDAELAALLDATSEAIDAYIAADGRGQAAFDQVMDSLTRPLHRCSALISESDLGG